MSDEPRHRTRRTFRVGVGWWASCLRCPWRGDPGPEWTEAKAAGRVHELYPQGIDWAQAEAWR